MIKGITAKTFPQYVARIVESILTAGETAKNIEIAISVDEDAMPTISYKVDGTPLIVPYSKGETNG